MHVSKKLRNCEQNERPLTHGISVALNGSFTSMLAPADPASVGAPFKRAQQKRHEAFIYQRSPLKTRPYADGAGACKYPWIIGQIVLPNWLYSAYTATTVIETNAIQSRISMIKAGLRRRSSLR
jgi:hypothetical protein